LGKQTGIAWMALSAVLFALMGFFARLASAGVHWTVVCAVRAALGAVVAVGFAHARGARMRVEDRRGIWPRSIFGVCSMACTFYALASPTLSLRDTATLLNMSPIFIAILSPPLLGERAERRVAIAIPLSVAGVLLILKPTFLFGGAQLGVEALRAAGSAVLAALASAFAMMALRRLGPRESPESIAIHFSVCATIVFSLACLPFLKVPSARHASYLAAAGLAAGFAQLAMTRAYALERAARVGSIAYLGVVVSAILGALALHEWPTWSAAVGMTLVIAAGLVIAFAATRQPSGERSATIGPAP
jgi:drug/metabolite transporter (DMT)-like permease